MRIPIRQFFGLSDKPIRPGDLVYATNARIRDGKIYTVPMPTMIYSGLSTGKGLYVWGHKDASVIVTFGGVGTARPHMEMNILDYNRDRVVSVDLSAFGVPYHRRIPLIVQGDSAWFLAGGQIWQMSYSPMKYGGLTYEPMIPILQAMTIGYEAGTASYLVEAPDAEFMAVHNGRVFYGGLSSKLYSVTKAVNPSDVPALAALAASSDGRWGYHPNMIIFSEPYQPNAIKAWSFLALEDPRSRVTGLVSYSHSLYIFTETGVWQYSGDDPLTAVLEKVPNMEGCINHYTIKVVGDTLFWLGPTGVNYIGPKGQGQVPGLAAFLGRQIVHLNEHGDSLRFDLPNVVAAGADVYGYYLLRLDGSHILVIDVPSKGATLLSDLGGPGSFVDIVGIGNSQIGGPKCDILMTFANGTANALFWDGPGGTSSATAEITLALPDVDRRIPWRSVDVVADGIGKINGITVGIVDGWHTDAKSTAYTATVKAEGWESMDALGGGFKIGTSRLQGSGYRHYIARFSMRSSQPLLFLQLTPRGAVEIREVILDGGPGGDNA